MCAIPRSSIFRNLNLPSVTGRGFIELLLGCGIAFPVLWVGMDIVASLAYDGYSYVDQTISELSAVDAPTRSFWLAGSVAYNALEIAFAVGVWQAAGSRRALRVVSGLLVTHAVINLVVGPFSSMHERQVLATGGATLGDTLHLVVVGLGALIFFSEIGFAVSVFGRWFGVYSAITALAMLVFGFITSVYAADVQANKPTPWLGIYERVNAYGYMLWVVVLAVSLLRLHRVGHAPA